MLGIFGKNLPMAAGASVEADPVDFEAALLPDLQGNYFHYTGSLTYSPCTEGVHWYVVQTAVNVTSAMLNHAKDAIAQAGIRSTGNNRALQPLNGRVVAFDSKATGLSDPVQGAKLSAKEALLAAEKVQTGRFSSSFWPQPFSSGFSYSGGSEGSSTNGVATAVLAVFGCCLCVVLTGVCASALSLRSKKLTKQKQAARHRSLYDEMETDPLYTASQRSSAGQSRSSASQSNFTSNISSEMLSDYAAAPGESYYERPAAASAGGPGYAAGPSSSLRPAGGCCNLRPGGDGPERLL